MGLIHRRYIEPTQKDALIYGCSNCKTHFSTTEEIISQAFQGQHGKAYLFDKVINITEGEAEDRMMTTGRHTVKDIMCSNCDIVVGWTYIKAYERREKYKEGKFILERQLLCEVS